MIFDFLDSNNHHVLNELTNSVCVVYGTTKFFNTQCCFTYYCIYILLYLLGDLVAVHNFFPY